VNRFAAAVAIGSLLLALAGFAVGHATRPTRNGTAHPRTIVRGKRSSTYRRAHARGYERGLTAGRRHGRALAAREGTKDAAKMIAEQRAKNAAQVPAPVLRALPAAPVAGPVETSGDVATGTRVPRKRVSP
jgi:hypothetical protein